MSLFSNPYMKWGVLPGAIGAGSGAAYAGYLNSADGTKYNLGYSALFIKESKWKQLEQKTR